MRKIRNRRRVRFSVHTAIKRELRRRSAIEPVIGHMKAEGHLGRRYLKGTAGDAANAILTAVGQPPPRPRLAEDSFAPDPARASASVRNSLRVQIGFLTDDELAWGLESDSLQRR